MREMKVKMKTRALQDNVFQSTCYFHKSMKPVIYDQIQGEKHTFRNTKEWQMHNKYIFNRHISCFNPLRADQHDANCAKKENWTVYR